MDINILDFYHIKEKYSVNKYHSMTMALLKVNEDIQEAGDDQKLSLLTLGLSKAFDTLDTGILLCKLRLLNLSDTAVFWFKSYFHNHQ